MILRPDGDLNKVFLRLVSRTTMILGTTIVLVAFLLVAFLLVKNDITFLTLTVMSP